MANGTAALATLELDPAPLTTPTAIEQAIGEVVADTTIATCAGAWEFEDGGISASTRAKTGDLFVRLYRLQEQFGEIGFSTVARREGRRVLLQRHGEDLRRQFEAALTEAALDEVLDKIIDWPLTILSKVTAVEKAIEQHGFETTSH
jgi:hypothetical protein